MNRIFELLAALEKPEVRARAARARADNICKICGDEARVFRTNLASLEYSISAICQDCQDYYLDTEIDQPQR